jgi:DNA transposition AAA+ family ATPase
MASTAQLRARTFIVTKEHRRFEEFASAVRKNRYIGLCFGAAGVGKTLSAQRYANWPYAEALLTEWGPRKRSDAKVYAALAQSRALFYTPAVSESVGHLRRDLEQLQGRANACIDLHGPPDEQKKDLAYRSNNIELVIIDEAERLSTSALEFVRDLFDRSDIGLTNCMYSSFKYWWQNASVLAVIPSNLRRIESGTRSDSSIRNSL